MPNKNPEVALDRRVEILVGQENGVHSVSYLRRFTRVVLIGEPGLGKSAALAREADEAQTKKINVRTLIHSQNIPYCDGRAHLDGLDEYRSDGSAADKANFLATALAQKCANGWILTCRSLDWRKDTDLNAIEEQYQGSDSIVVAKLLPLEKCEACSILSSVGEKNTDTFYEDGQRMGAQAFLGNPLSLLLLQKIVATNGSWPKTKYEVFDQATLELCSEVEECRNFQARNTPTNILIAAEKLCALLLITKSRTFWTSNARPMVSHDTTEFLETNKTALEQNLINHTLDTPLFTGEGKEFEPIHRSIAEFLAARFLATKATGIGTTPAVPFSRLLGLVCASDGNPQTDLRGVFAWLAVHLEKLGKSELARTLCQKDPLTVVANGDAGVFSTEIRKYLLASLHRDDPLFPVIREDKTFLSTLAGEDLAVDFASILRGTSGTGYAFYTAIDILTTGKPVLSLRPCLREICLDPKREEWQRWRAFEVWLKGENHPQAAMRKLFDNLATEPPSIGRENLRANIASQLDEHNLNSSDIYSILGDFESLDEDTLVGRFVGLVHRLEKIPVWDFFEKSTDCWRPDNANNRNKSQVTSVLDQIFSDLIRKHEALDAKTLWRWMENCKFDRWVHSSKKFQKEISKWLKRDPENEEKLFIEALNSVQQADLPLEPYNKFMMMTGHGPSEQCIEKLISVFNLQKGSQNSLSKPITDSEKRLLAAITECCRSTNHPWPVYWRVYEIVQSALGEGEFLNNFTVCELSQCKLRQAKENTKEKTQAKSDKAERIATWAGRKMLLKTGEGELDYAAMIYFGCGYDIEQKCSRENLKQHFNSEIAQSIISGFKRRAEIGLDVPFFKIGRLRVHSSRNCMETAIAAGVSILLKENNNLLLNKLSLEVAILALLHRYYISEEEHRRELKLWAFRKLDQEPEHSSELLVAYWLDGVKARTKAFGTSITHEFDLMNDFSYGSEKSLAASMALTKLVAKRINFSSRALPSLARAICHQWNAKKILETCKATISDTAIPKENSQFWVALAFAISPEELRGKFHSMFHKDGKALVELAYVAEATAKAFPLSAAKDQVVYYGSVIEILGPIHSPSGKLNNLREIIRKSINNLAIVSDPEVRKELQRLRSLPTLAEWGNYLTHALSNNLRKVRDNSFTRPSIEQVTAVLDGGPPINASDLRAVINDVLTIYQQELDCGDIPGWKGFWNTDKYGKATDPKIENDCRDHLLMVIRPRLANFNIHHASPEAQVAGGRRTDILLATEAGNNLPIEVKRHFNRELYSAISEQLQDYADGPNADGHGIYLVFWFGTSVAKSPKVPNGKPRPSTAAELRNALMKNMLPEQKNMIDVVVLDVAPPEGSLAKCRSKKRSRRSSKNLRQ